MAVVCVQTLNGQVQVEVTIPPNPAAQTDQQLLDWKGQTHADNGWSVAWAGNRRSFTANKTYPSGLTKQRAFRRVA